MATEDAGPVRKGKGNGRSLIDYERAKRRAACAVCSLPDALLAQVRVAREKKIAQPVVREWLKSEHGVELSRADFMTHNSAHHETWEAES